MEARCGSPPLVGPATNDEEELSGAGGRQGRAAARGGRRANNATMLW